MTKRDIKGRYKGSMLGVWWAIAMPMAMLAVFTFVFAGVFEAKWHASGSTVDFVLNMYAGLIVFWYFSEVVGKAPTLITAQPNFVKKVVFPLEVLPIVSILSALFHLLINMAILLVAVFLYKGGLGVGVVCLPLVIVVTIPILLGASWVLSSVGVYIRDIAAVIGIVMNMLMFLSPIFYPIEAVPASIKWAFELNPLTPIIEWVRVSAIEGEWPNVTDMAIFGFVCVCIAWLGAWCFGILRKGFADVL